MIVGGRRPMVRSIVAVIDNDNPTPDSVYPTSASLLDPLSAPRLAEFRKEIRERFSIGYPRILCAGCRQPVYVSLEGSGVTQNRDGKDAFFAHHAGTAIQCEWGTTSQRLATIDRNRFNGATEGPQHIRLKNMLARILHEDQHFQDVRVESVIMRCNEWRKPDVSAVFENKRVAFELQLSTTHLPVLVDRENFYKKNNMRLMWLTSASKDNMDLSRQVFQDIYWNNQEQIFAVDEQALEQTKISGVLHLWNLRIVPELNSKGLAPKWRKTLVSRNQIDWNTSSGHPVVHEKEYGEKARELVLERFRDPLAKFIDELGKGRENGHLFAGKAWNEIASQINAIKWNEAEFDGAFGAFGVLASVAAGKKLDSSRYGKDKLVDIINNFLEQNSSRKWTNILQQIARAYDHNDLISRASTQKKIDRNRRENQPDLQRKYKPMLEIIFSRAARYWIGNPPKIDVTSLAKHGKHAEQ